MKVSVKDGTISNKSTMGKRLERFGEVRIIDETNGFGLDFVEKIVTSKQSWNLTNGLLLNFLFYLKNASS